MAETRQSRSALLYIRQTAARFLDREKVGGLVLIGITIMALMIGNSQWATSYHHYLEDKFLFEFTGHFSFGLTMEEWINDGLMTIFFLLMGLELKRELLVGELSSIKKASMPLIGAVGGMAIPALIFWGLNSGTETAHGWGIPMATDIAYSLGIMSLIGSRVPTQLKVLLVGLAIADDLGAILLIAFIYSQELNWVFLTLGLGVFAVLLICNRLEVKSLFWYLLGGLVLWYCFLNSGIHPTVAGVLTAMSVPVRPKLDSLSLKEQTRKNLDTLERIDIRSHNPLQNRRQRKILRTIKQDANKSRPPLLKLENALVDFNAFFVVPVFAFANAGVTLDSNVTKVFAEPLGLGIILGLAVGKVMGIGLFSYLGDKLGLAKLDSALSWTHLIGMGMIAGIGFTMSLFITNLAFVDPAMIKISKVSILIASLISALGGIFILLYCSPSPKR